jgi:hypothetical protein
MRKSWILATCMCAASLLAISGCGAVVDARPLEAHAPHGGFSESPSATHGVLSSVLFRVSGTITKVEKSSDKLQYLLLKVTKTYNDADGPSPFSTGSTMKFDFDESLSKLGNSHLNPGEHILIQFGRFKVPGHTSVVLGSNFGWVKVIKKG